ncbi:MAG: hypothetical protein KDB80_18075 [Planctomycetes bacterium]|nr:hypothetical protein [Planctomycetota bacterium]
MSIAPAFDAHWIAGWALLLGGFLTGALLGTGFHRTEFVGGYSSLRRRLWRLGHIACCALGILNLVTALAPVAPRPALGSTALIVGSIAMPLACFAVGCSARLRLLFLVPVMALVLAAITYLNGELP